MFGDMPDGAAKLEIFKETALPAAGTSCLSLRLSLAER